MSATVPGTLQGESARRNAKLGEFVSTGALCAINASRPFYGQRGDLYILLHHACRHSHRCVCETFSSKNNHKCALAVALGIGYFMIRRRRKWSGPLQKATSMMQSSLSSSSVGIGALLAQQSANNTLASRVFSTVLSKKHSLTHANNSRVHAIEWLHEKFSRSVILSVHFLSFYGKSNFCTTD